MCLASDMATVDCESLMFFIRRIDRRRSLFPSLSLSSCLYFFLARGWFFARCASWRVLGLCARPVCFHPTKYICCCRRCHCCCGSSPRVRANDYSARWKISVIISARERERERASRENFFYCVLGCALPKQRAERYKIFRLFSWSKIFYLTQRNIAPKSLYFLYILGDMLWISIMILLKRMKYWKMN